MLKALGFALLVFCGGLVHASGHLLGGWWAGARVEEFTVGVGPRLIGLGAVVVRLVPLWAWVSFQGQFQEGHYRHLSPWRRMVIALAGPVASFLGAVFFLACMASVWGRVVAGPAAVEVHRVEPGTPAQRAGLRRGDRFLSLEGAAWQGMADLRRRLAASPLQVRVERAGGDVVLVLPRVEEGRRIGLKMRPPIGFQPLELVRVPGYAFRCAVSIALAPLRAPRWREGLVSLPDGGILAGPSAWRDFPGAGWLVGLGAVNAWLALMFLLPLPGLDGMRVCLQLLQIRGAPLPTAVEEQMQRYGVPAFATAYAFILGLIATSGG